MIEHTNAGLQPRSNVEVSAPSSKRIASLDVEWQKNYRIKNGNRPFCYSIVWLQLPEGDGLSVFGRVRFEFKSVYLEPSDRPEELAAAVDRDLAKILAAGDVLVGHQLCSDLAVLQAQLRDDTLPTVARAQDGWHRRKLAELGERTVIDTRFDLGHLLEGHSRRLVDVCTELGLDVRQPELKSRSMTALHRDWLDTRSITARERITVLNLRHSLSTGLLAMMALGRIRWRSASNVNRLIERELRGRFSWLATADFRDLLDRR